MKEDEKKILDIFEQVIPDMTDGEREKLLEFGESIISRTEKEKRKKDEEKEVG